MKSRWLLSVVLTAVLSVSAFSQVIPGGQKHIIDATNRLIEIVNKSPIPSAEEIKEIANLGCQTLRRALSDKEFLQAVEKLESSKKKHWEEYQRLINDLEAFHREFLIIERKAWNEAGISDTAADNLLRQISTSRWRLDSIDTSGGNLISILRQTQDSACALAKVAIDAARARSTAARAVRIAYGVGAAAIIVTDAWMALAPPAAAASLALAGMLTGPLFPK